MSHQGYATYNAADFGPPAVPLVTDDEGNVLNPTVGQVYEIRVALSVTELGTLPKGNPEKGLASVQFDVALQGLSEDATAPGWYFDRPLRKHVTNQPWEFRLVPSAACWMSVAGR